MDKIEELIEASLDDLGRIIFNPNIDNPKKVIFPNDSLNGMRFSEQELKMVFIENLLQNSNLKYSVETPTSNYFRFAEEYPLFSKDKKKGYRPAQIDVSIYEKSLQKNIEFKYGQIQTNAFPIEKDLLKMLVENDSMNYFVHYLVTKSDQKTTRDELSKKYKKAENKIHEKLKKKEISIEGYKSKKECVKIISRIYILDKKKIYKNSFLLSDVEKNEYR